MRTIHRRHGRARLAARSLARRAYDRLARGPFRRVAEAGAVQRLRGRWAHPMDLADVQEILGILDRSQVRYWLAGGWGVDALLGRQTRRHKDLDLLVDEADLERGVRALVAHGFGPMRKGEGPGQRYVPGTLLPERHLVQDGATRTVDLHPVDPRTWPAPLAIAVPFATGTLGSRSVRCISVEAQRAAHEGFELGDEHRHDLRALDGLALPHS